MITDLAHSAFRVHNLEKSLAFYELLGLRESFRLNHDDSSVMLHRVLMASPGSLPERVVSFVPALVASCGPLPIHRQSTIDAAKAFTDETVELWIGTVFRYLDIVAAEADPASDISWEH